MTRDVGQGMTVDGHPVPGERAQDERRRLRIAIAASAIAGSGLVVFATVIGVRVAESRAAATMRATRGVSAVVRPRRPVRQRRDQSAPRWLNTLATTRDEAGDAGGAVRRGAQPSTMPSVSADGVGSGRRIIRNEKNSPSRAARIGMARATCRASGRASVLMRMTSSWISAG